MEFKNGTGVHQKIRFPLTAKARIRMYNTTLFHTLINKKSLLITNSLLKKVDTFDIKVDYFGKNGQKQSTFV
jgi:hypothetical protein